MKRSKSIVARDARQLAAALGLTPADAVEMEVRSTLNDKIVDVVGRLALTHAQVAKLCGTSRTRITAIMNRNTQDVSTDLLLRILARLGYRAKISFSKAALTRITPGPSRDRLIVDRHDEGRPAV